MTGSSPFYYVMHSIKDCHVLSPTRADLTHNAHDLLYPSAVNEEDRDMLRAYIAHDTSDKACSIVQ